MDAIVSFFVLLATAIALGFACGWLSHKSIVLLGWLKQPQVRINLQIDDAIVIQQLRQKGYSVDIERRALN
jgi:hypothetical protein